MSNQHEFHGVIAFQKLLGPKPFIQHTQFVFAGDERDVFSESFVSWYDAAEFNANYPERWRLYYPDTFAMSHARPGDMLMIARLDDETLLVVMAQQTSAAATWIMERYADDPRLTGLAPPKAEDFATPTLPLSFSRAKTLLRRGVYDDPDERRTLYCGCDYSRDGMVDPLTCGYEAKRPGSTRSRRMEWEHIVPASVIGRGRSCWSEGHAECVTRSGSAYKGRRCCAKVDDIFRQANADLKNLAPAIGELNADRSNLPHGEVPDEPRVYGACDFEVSRKPPAAEPAIPLRGFIARTWIYMNHTYALGLSDNDMAIYYAWAQAYPAQQWETERNNRIERTIIHPN